jgi:NAD(P)-dependent dehydrogenase (short-subunit alcohol dehydrogenase family)
MSKMAVEVYTEALDPDIEKDGMHAAVIAPGGFKSKIREKVAMHMISGNYEMGQDESQLNAEQKKQLEDMRASNAALKEPDAVSEAVLTFLSSDSPKIRYMVTPNQNQATITVTAAMKRLLETNADQPFALSRDELIKLMDELSQ